MHRKTYTNYAEKFCQITDYHYLCQRNEGTVSPLISLIYHYTMITTQLIESIANDYLAGSNLSLVEVIVSEENDIEVVITRKDAGVSIDDCANLSRHIESKLDRDKEDFSLMVASAGI